MPRHSRARNLMFLSGKDLRYADGRSPKFTNFEPIMGPDKQREDWTRRCPGNNGYRKQIVCGRGNAGSSKILYELAIGSGSGKRIVYLGQSVGGCRRIQDYLCDGSHLKRQINQAIAAGNTIYIHTAAVRDPRAREGELLDKYTYPWNQQ